MTATIDQASAATVDTAAAEELAGRLFGAVIGATELATIYLGEQLGLYRALTGGPLAAAELATRTGMDERYVLEWAQQQAIAGLLVADGDDPAAATYALAPGAREVLVDETNPNDLAALGPALVGIAGALPSVRDAFHTGAGLPWAAYGDHVTAAQAALNRPAFVNELAAAWLPAIPEVATRLADAGAPARVLDLGCGAGWSSIELVKAYSHITVVGLDNDEASVALARRNAAEHGVTGRVDFEVRDIAAPDNALAGQFDVAFFFERVHALPRPVEALGNARRWVKPGGAVIVMDERTADSFTAPADEIERFFAAASVTLCLPAGRVGPDAEPIGTLMRAADLRAVARHAGFDEVDVLPIEHPFFRFYSLR